MASSEEKNVFGAPVTKGTRRERAIEALKNPDAGGKHGQALAYLREQKKLSNQEVSTLCLFYNATGQTLVHSCDLSWDGMFYPWPPQKSVQNGQWGAFLHVGTGRSSGFVVYRVLNDDTDYSSELLGWDTSGKENHAYCDIFNNGEVDPPDVVYKKIKPSSRQHDVSKNGWYTTASIEEGTSPVYEATLALEEAED